MKMFIFLAGCFLLFAFIHYAGKKKKPFRRAFLSMLAGVAVLTAVNLSAGLTGVYIPVTELSLLISTVGGAPGVALMVLLSAF